MGDEDAIAAALARGKVAAERLAAVTDELNENIELIERSLADQRLGVEASVSLYAEATFVESVGFVHEKADLSFRKEGKAWRLVVDSGVEEAENWTTQPLVNASRETRLLAIEKLPELIAKLADASEARLAEVEAKNAAADKLLAALRASGGPKARTK